jgi:hypothetical protein
MSKLGTRFEIQLNEKLIAAATLSLSDQVEINLVSLPGQEDAVLTVTAFLPNAPKKDHYLHTRNTVVSPGDTLTIALEDVKTAISTRLDTPTGGAADVSATSGVVRCSFCGKSQHEVRKVVAGPDVIICDECVALCNDIMSNET